MKRVSITILVENQVDNPLLIAENGLSLLIEVDEMALLFDTGQKNALCHNSNILGIDLNKVKWIIVSHGHYDHGGGLLEFAQKYKNSKVLVHPFYFNKKYVTYKGNKRFIGVPYTKEVIENFGLNVILKNTPYEFEEGIFFSGEIKRITDYEKVEDIYFERILESDIHDELKDDISLVIDTPKGLLVFLGCGHSGVVNTCKHALKITGRKNIHLVMGGMHLKNAEESVLQSTIHELKEINPDFIIPLHCTGYNMINKLRQTFGTKRIPLLHVGDKWEISYS